MPYSIELPIQSELTSKPWSHVCPLLGISKTNDTDDDTHILVVVSVGSVSPDLIPFHLLIWQLVIGCTDHQI